jgi:hypothetical protein
MIRAAVAFVIAFTLMWGLQGTWQAVHGQIYGPSVAGIAGECPPDRPIKRFAVRYPVTQTCTAVVCSPRLKCPADSDQCYSVVEDCNKCSPAPVTEQICLSQEELDRAR